MTDQPRNAATGASQPGADTADHMSPDRHEHVLDTVPEGPQTVVLSHENLAGAMPGNGGETRLYPALPGMMTRLTDDAEARGIPWLRLNQQSLVQLGHGKYQQRIQATVTGRTPGEYLVLTQGAFSDVAS